MLKQIISFPLWLLLLVGVGYFCLLVLVFIKNRSNSWLKGFEKGYDKAIKKLSNKEN